MRVLFFGSRVNDSFVMRSPFFGGFFDLCFLWVLSENLIEIMIDVFHINAAEIYGFIMLSDVND